MNPETQALTDQVAASVTVEESARVLITGFADQLTAARDAQDWAAVTTLIDSLKTSSTALAAAVVANTPAAPAA